MLFGKGGIVDPIDHMIGRVAQSGDLGAENTQRHGHRQRFPAEGEGKGRGHLADGGVALHVDAHPKGGSALLRAAVRHGFGDVVDLEGRAARDEVFDLVVVGGGVRFGAAVFGHAGGEQLIDLHPAPRRGKSDGDLLAAGEGLVGEDLKVDVAAPRGKKARGGRAAYLTVGIDPLVFGKDLILHSVLSFTRFF